MRAAIVNGKSGFVAAVRSRGTQEEVFVLFDGDGPEESGAGWFPADQVTLYGYGDRVWAWTAQATVLGVHTGMRGLVPTELEIKSASTGHVMRLPADSPTLRKAA
jgi:hypothetical protein